MDEITLEIALETKMKRRVKGVAAVGDLVGYRDMANPGLLCRVEHVRTGHGVEYELLVLNGWKAMNFIYSDLRQYGWTFEEVRDAR